MLANSLAQLELPTFHLREYAYTFRVNMSCRWRKPHDTTKLIFFFQTVNNKVIYPIRAEKKTARPFQTEQFGNVVQHYMLFEHLVDKSLSLGLMTSEVYIELHRVLLAALREQLVAECIRHLAVEDSLLLEE